MRPPGKEGNALDQKLRHEVKHYLSYGDLLELRPRLRAVMASDSHARDGRYLIRSLYFDNLFDKALNEKIDGVSRRAKFRVRFYDLDTSYICLEKKVKTGGLGNKQQTVLTASEAEDLSRGVTGWMAEDDRPLVRELYARMTTEGLAPKTIVEYTREPFVYAPGNVRVTLDYGIRTGLGCTDFLDPGCVTVPVPDDPIILEVKWDEYLPDIIRDIVQVPGTRSTAYSKYAACRSYDL